MLGTAPKTLPSVALFARRSYRAARANIVLRHNSSDICPATERASAARQLQNAASFADADI